jgi:hypothetical protein
MPSKTKQSRPEADPPARARTRSRRPAERPDADPVPPRAESAPVLPVRPAAKARPARKTRPVPAVDPAPAPSIEPDPSPAPAPAHRGRRRAAPAPVAPDAVAEAVAELLADAAPAPDVAPPAPAVASRRGTAKPRRHGAAAVAEKAAAAETGGHAEPTPEVDSAPSPRQRRGGRDRTAAAAPPAPVPPLPPAAPAAEITPPVDGSLFGRYAVLVAGEEAAEVTLRDARCTSVSCTCLDFELSEDADCPHVDALFKQWLADPGRAQALARGPQQPFSRIVLQRGARHRPLWLPGTECPPALAEQAEPLLAAANEAADDQALPRLLRAARDAGHELQVDEAVWTHLAATRDARWRVHRLEALLPQGPASPALQQLRPEPLLPLQLEGALFAVCAGRCILADDAVLQPMLQALAAAALWQRHFGVERVLLLAPSDQLDRWRRLLPADAEGWSLTSIERLVGDAGLHRSLAPELVIVHEPAAGGLWVDAERATALLRLDSAHAIVLPAADWLERPAELPLRLAYVDRQRLGAYAALLRSHGERDEAGQLCGLRGLDGLRATLEAVLLMRHKSEVLQQLPERIDRVRRVALPTAEAERHAALADQLAASLARWQRSGWLPDSEQRRLLDQMQALRRLCAGEGAPGIAAAKAEAVLALLNDADAPVAKLVVFSQWPAALDALQTALAVAGVGTARWSLRDAEGVRRAAATAFQSDPDCRLLLVADAASGALELHCPDAQVLHLDRPWNPRLLARRFGRVHRRGQAHLVPVTQLLVEGSFEHALHALQARRSEPMPDLLDAQAAEGFVQGEDLQRLQADLASLLAPPAAVGATPA